MDKFIEEECIELKYSKECDKLAKIKSDNEHHLVAVFIEEVADLKKEFMLGKNTLKQIDSKSGSVLKNKNI